MSLTCDFEDYSRNLSRNNIVIAKIRPMGLRALLCRLIITNASRMIIIEIKSKI